MCSGARRLPACPANSSGMVVHLHLILERGRQGCCQDAQSRVAESDSSDSSGVPATAFETDRRRLRSAVNELPCILSAVMQVSCHPFAPEDGSFVAMQPPPHEAQGPPPWALDGRSARGWPACASAVQHNVSRSEGGVDVKIWWPVSRRLAGIVSPAFAVTSTLLRIWLLRQ
jgi:hypothetical protein